MSQVSIREKILEPIESLFKKTLIVIFALTILSSGYQIISSRQQTQSFLATFANKISQSADLDGSLIYLQKEIDQLMSSIEASGLTGGHILVTINGRNAAEAGNRTFGYSTMTMTTTSVLQSGNVVGVQIDVDIAQILKREFLWGLISFSILLVLLLGVKSRVARSLTMITQPIEVLASNISKMDTSASPNAFEGYKDSNILEISKLSNSFQGFLVRIKTGEEQIAQLQKNEIFSNISKQVAHDIRSPLSALSMAMHGLSEIPEARRLLIRNAVQRINDIANDLLNKGKQAQLQKTEGFTAALDSSTVHLKAPQSSSFLLPAIVDSIISEKRIQFRDKINISIEADLKESFGIFINANATEFGRLISNLVNNSIEAFANGKGEIVVAVRAYNGQALLTISDNGKGIPEHILAKLGQPGVSHGKNGTESGSGLGVYHAKKTVEAWGGKFEIRSSEGTGTTIKINLPRAVTPTWFAEIIQIASGSTVVAVDDDLSIHQIWKGRLDSINANATGITLRSFTSAADFKSFQLSDNMIFLMDYELLNQKENGLDLIKDRNISSKSILVTSRHEEPHIRDACEKLHIKLLPKQLAGFVPMQIVTQQPKLDYILIDDDDLTQMSWKMNAENLGHQMKGYLNIEDFKKDLTNLDKAIKIYIDSDLGNNELGHPIKGENLAQDLHVTGFHNIYLATGYEANNFSNLAFLKGIVGKDPPTNV